MTGPLGFPWSTFAALLVVVASIVVSLIWALTRSDDDSSGEGEP